MMLRRCVFIFFLLVLPKASHAAFTHGMGGVVGFFGFTDYALLIGSKIHPDIPDPTAENVNIRNEGIQLTYIGGRGFYEILSIVRVGVEGGAGINFRNPNDIFDAHAFLFAVFVQWTLFPIISIEIDAGYHFLALDIKDKKDVVLDHFYVAPRVVLGFNFFDYFGIHFFAGFLLPIHDKLWDALVGSDKENAILKAKGFLGTLHVGVDLVISEDVFGTII